MKTTKTIVVLIDDDKITNFINHKIIERRFSGVTIEIFCSGYAAIDFLRNVSSQKRVIMLLDVNMPGISGWDFLKILKEELPNANFSIHVLTSSTDSQDIRKSEEFKMVRSFISKPLTVKKLENLNID